MVDSLNILILSCGTRNKIVQYFKKELSGKGKVFATDCTPLAPALYEADDFFIVPRVQEEGYLEEVLSICKDNSIKAVFSLIDPELNVLAEYKDLFLELGVTPVVSEKEAIEMSLDKYAMFT
ncbi:MAG: carbamoyl phosphate synthase, partial [Staphylococcus equorum]|nr:carbamoyl phosphate synthase [Staphylococcus equorum]